MARIVIVHGAFNELWGPNELKARWLPAVRDGLWHHGVEVEADDVDVCFYGDLFRHHPGSDEDRQLQQSRAGVADMLSEMGGDAIAALCEAAGDAMFDRTVDMATVMLTEPDLRDRLQERIEAEITGGHPRAGGAFAWHGPVLRRAGGARRLAGPHVRHPRFAARLPGGVQQPRAGARRRAGGVARLGAALGERASVGDKAAACRSPRSSARGSRRSSSTTGTGPHAPEPYLNCLADRRRRSPAALA